MTTDLDEALRIANLRTFQEFQAIKLGTEEQRAMFAEGVLPSEELEKLARDELFRPFEPFPRWQQIKHTDVLHEDGCRARTTSEVHSLNVPLKRDEWDTFSNLMSTAALAEDHAWLEPIDAVFKVEPIAHVVRCPQCKARKYATSAKVSIPWAGRILTREYAL